MRKTPSMLRAILLTGLLLSSGLPVVAQEDISKIPKRPDFKIARVQMGYAAGPFSGEVPDDTGGKQAIFRSGAWIPIFVDIETMKDYRDLELVAECADGDDIQTIARAPLPPLQAGDPSDSRKPFMHRQTIYLKPGSMDLRLTISVRSIDSQRSVGERINRNLASLSPRHYVVTTVGSSISGIRLGSPEKAIDQEEEDNPNAGLSNYKLQKGLVQVGQIIEVSLMPDRWYGYKGCDQVILPTGGNLEFWTTLAQPAWQSRRVALKEWVRRGGQLVVSVGVNADVLEALPELKDLLPAKIDPKGKREAENLRLVGKINRLPQMEILAVRDAKRSRLLLAGLEPLKDRNAMIVVTDDSELRRPLIVQGGYGLGRVTLVGFDIDRSPVSGWASAPAFWEYLLNVSGPRLPVPKPNETYLSGEDTDPVLGTLQNNLDFFEGVPVISFGWVALFILGYILLIGPVDYYILKKIFGRLEWTWFTFPLIVIVVSAGAYFAAYEIKGRDLKINKVDLVDIDLTTNRVQGQTWFTIFSPRRQFYNITAEPIGDNQWTPATLPETTSDLLIAWQGKTIERRQGLSRKSYEFSVDLTKPDDDHFASSLERVPIQVWSTKSFTSEWSARMSKEKPLIDVSGLKINAFNTDVLQGEILSNLPVDVLEDIRLIWRGKVLKLPSLTRGIGKQVTFDAGPQSTTASVEEWLKEMRGGPGLSDPARNQQTPVPIVSPGFRLWSMFFNDRIESGKSESPSSRPLDQSWRLATENRGEMLLVARIPTQEKDAEEFSNNPASVTRLWLNEIPGQNARTPLLGKMRQETYIRCLIPLTVPTKK